MSIVKRAIVAGLAAASLASMPVAAADADPDLTGTWFDGLEAGVCFDDAFDDAGDFDFSIPAPVVPCEGPHQNEVVGRVPLGEAAHPGEDTVQIVDDACFVLYEEFLGRPIGSTLMFPFSVAPGEADWAAGVRDGLCSVYSGDSTPGTAASGSLRTPGELIAAYREVEGEPDIWLIDAGTGEALHNVTDNGMPENITSPSWSPDGKGIVFALDPSGAGEISDIFQVSLDDGTTVPLVAGPAEEDGGVISPDGKSLVFISDVGAAEFEIYKRDLETGAVTRLTDYPDRDSSPQWSPDGDRIAFRRRSDEGSDIWTMDPDGTNLVRLTDNGADNYDPRWSPDGTRIAFTTNLAGNYDIGLMNADGSEQHLVTTHPADDEYPTWSSDGRIMAFHSTRHGGTSLWLMRTDGTEQSELTGLAPVGFAMFAPAAPE